jgi:DNA-binding GntR family transcriptional regulator
MTESTYRTLTERVLAGAFAPGARIDVNEIAAAVGVSPTPVRNALNRLVGAGLLASHSNEGFFAPILSEQDLRELYDSSDALIGLAIDRAASARRPAKPAPVDRASAKGAIEEHTDAAFRDIMRLSANTRLCGVFADVSLRLGLVRLQEGGLINNRNAELRRILKAYEAPDFVELARLIGAYHRRRIRLAPQLLARMQQRFAHAASAADEVASERA